VFLDKDFLTFGSVIVLSASESASLLGLLYPEEKKKKYDPPKRRELFIQRLRVTSQHTRTFSKNAVRTPNLSLCNQQSTKFRYYRSSVATKKLQHILLHNMVFGVECGSEIGNVRRKCYEEYMSVTERKSRKYKFQ